MAKRNISVDQTFDEVIASDQKGDLLIFEHEPGKFLKLTQEQVDSLSLHNRAVYMLSKDMYEKELRLAEVPEFMRGIEVNQYARPSQRLNVEGKDPNTHYVWKRPDEFREALRDGYKAVQGDTVETYASRVGSSHVIGEQGHEELVLMQIPKDRYMARLRAVEEISQRRVKGAEATALDDMRRKGGSPLESDDTTSGGWRVVEENEGEE